ncbi:MAG: virulence RhuM family protein [Ruminococcus sp.]|nr:virulence RhuM family protein [Ruminococcus sp.]MCM1154329.1 virulence RhuM family protein [Roseburia sp.]
MEKSEVLLYVTEDGTVKLEVAMEAETVWLNLSQLCELFQRDKSVISRHIKNIFAEGELEQDSVVAFFATTAEDGKTYQVAYYNLDVIISVGYRVKSIRGTQFRKWALKVLKEYMIKGFAMDDDRLKNLGGGNYFEELLSRIRSIRASEKVFWRKVLDIYATSIDYEPKSEISVQFFKQVQNKMHWAAHRHTAAEVIFERADSEKEFMGLTSWRGEFPERADVTIAKNYLSREEIEILDRLVSAYLDIAELRAMNREPMYMKDWIETIDDYLKMTRRDILTHKGKISHRQAIEKAHKEYEKYSEKTKLHLSAVEKHYLETISTLEGIEKKQE